MSKLTNREESKIYEASLAGVQSARIAELVGCTEKQVLATLEDYRRLEADRDAWEAALAAEKASRA